MADVVFGITFSVLGFILIFHRQKVIDALTASNQVFWGKLGYTPDEKRAAWMSKIMIPFMGAMFLAGGVIFIYRVVIYLLK